MVETKIKLNNSYIHNEKEKKIMGNKLLLKEQEKKNYK